MDKELELKINAAMAELTAQRDSAFARCAQMAGDIAILKNELEELKKPKD